MKSYKHLFSRALAAAPSRMHFAAHSHHLWPDASYEGHVAAWNDAATLADKKWDRVLGEVIPRAQASIATELKLPDAQTIAFASNTHELIERIFSACKPGVLDVLTTDGEFHSFRRQATRWEEEGRVVRRVVPCEPYDTFTERFVAEARRKVPDIMFLSHVMFKSGLRFDGIAELASFASPNGTWVVFDIYHSFMAFPADFSRVADRVFLLGGGYKYAMAGEGMGFLHAPPGFASRPCYTGWFADFGAIEAKQDKIGYGTYGSRFLGATFDPSGLYRFNSVQSALINENLDTTTITTHAAALRSSLEDAIGRGAAGVLHQAELLQPNAHGHNARFVSLRDARAVEWKTRLMEAGIVTDARDDVLRIGVGLYHDQADVAALCDGIAKSLGKAA